MLDPSGDKEVKAQLDQYKKRISENLQQDINYREMSDEQRERMVGPHELISLHDALATIQNPRMHLMEIHKTIGQLIYQLEEMHGQIESGAEQEKNGEGGDEDQVLSGVRFYQVRWVPKQSRLSKAERNLHNVNFGSLQGETLVELIERWRFIYERLYDVEKDKFDLSRVPDVHDNVRYVSGE